MSPLSEVCARGQLGPPANVPSLSVSEKGRPLLQLASPSSPFFAVIEARTLEILRILGTPRTPISDFLIGEQYDTEFYHDFSLYSAIREDDAKYIGEKLENHKVPHAEVDGAMILMHAAPASTEVFRLFLDIIDAEPSAMPSGASVAAFVCLGGEANLTLFVD
jgi:hypothetical protein